MVVAVVVVCAHTFGGVERAVCSQHSSQETLAATYCISRPLMRPPAKHGRSVPAARHLVQFNQRSAPSVPSVPSAHPSCSPPGRLHGPS